MAGLVTDLLLFACTFTFVTGIVIAVKGSAEISSALTRLSPDAVAM
jgi:hypothetical protein